MKQIVLFLLTLVVNHVSDDILDELSKLVDRLDEKAAATPNPFDDLLVNLLRKILSACGES